jgi:hypothetical protein
MQDDLSRVAEGGPRQPPAFQLSCMKNTKSKGVEEMKTGMKITVAFAFALFGAFAAVAQQQTLTGVLSDSMCGAAHMVKDKSPAECTRMCVKDGMKYALVVDKKLYTLDGHETELAKLAGEKVTITGTVTGSTIAVQSVRASK